MNVNEVITKLIKPRIKILVDITDQIHENLENNHFSALILDIKKVNKIVDQLEDEDKEKIKSSILKITKPLDCLNDNLKKIMESKFCQRKNNGNGNATKIKSSLSGLIYRLDSLIININLKT
jgi:hypothetical protein